MRKVGIRREDKDAWEARVPLVPDDVKGLVASGEATVCVQSSAQRAFADDAYAAAGAVVTEDLDECDVVLAVKEIPEAEFRPGKTYVFFSHTIKGQPYNMDMLRRMMELGCQLLDYERIVDEHNARLISFSRFAGIAGVVDTLWALGRRLEREGLSPNPFAALCQTHAYGDVGAALRAVAECGERLAAEGVPEALDPLVIGVTGYGRVSRGAQEAIDALDPVTVTPEDLEALVADPPPEHRAYKVVFHEEDTVTPKEASDAFDLDDFCRHPEKYRGTFARFLPSLNVLVNAVYWEERYPRLVTKADLRELWARDERPRLTVIGDVTCDIGGSVECTLKDTHVDEPVYVYDPVDDVIRDGAAGRGVVVMAVGNLPCELSCDASEAFSHVLATLMPALTAADFSAPFDELALPGELKRALILHHGELTPDYDYLRSFL
jgi:saccharopine dehydrogenase (NAD+, L-lysine-forming)